MYEPAPKPGIWTICLNSCPYSRIQMMGWIRVSATHAGWRNSARR
jgi:hypothetical protein